MAIEIFYAVKNLQKQSNLTLLPDPFFLNFFDLKIALSHGDRFCTEDLEYIKFKKEVRSQKWQQEFLQKPLIDRLNIASNMRDASPKIIEIKMLPLWMLLLLPLKNFLMNII